MRFVILALLSLATCVADAKEHSEQEASVRIAMQHSLVDSLSAIYWCKNHLWPNSSAELQAFAVSTKVSLPEHPNWELLGSSSFTFQASEILVVRSEPNAVLGAHGVTSWNLPPHCNGNAVEIRTHIHIDEQPPSNNSSKPTPLRGAA